MLLILVLCLCSACSQASGQCLLDCRRKMHVKVLRHSCRSWSATRWRPVNNSILRRNRTAGCRMELLPKRLASPETRGYVPVLAPSQITALLREHEESGDIQKWIGGGPVQYFDSNLLASNQPTEDRRAVGWLTQTGGSLFGIFDGHGGAQCAQAVSEQLFEYIAVSMLPSSALQMISHFLKREEPFTVLARHRFRTDDARDELLHMHRQNIQRFVDEILSLNDYHSSSTNACKLSMAFHRLDEDILQEAMPVSERVDKSRLEAALSGCCACVAHVKDTDVEVANVGDCRAVIGRLQPDSRQWSAIPMSSDQNIDNCDELKRVYDAHPKEAETININDRLLGHLIPLRAFGDLRFKWTAAELKLLAKAVGGIRENFFVPSNYFTPPYLTASPDVIRHQISRDDRFMIIASDGLWEKLTNEQAVKIVGDHMLDKESRRSSAQISYGSMTFGEIANLLHTRRHACVDHQPSDNNSATHLIRHALGFDHRKVSGKLTLSRSTARRFRDDISVIVVYFHADFASENGRFDTH